ncbi:MAG: hypothetical protein AB1489_07360 [Acidobacteriota bacterium]
MSEKLQMQVLNKRVRNGLFVLGLLFIIIGQLISEARFWQGFLLTSFFFLSIALGALVFISIHHISNAGWPAAIRRIPEAVASYIPFAGAAMLMLYWGRKTVYQWTHAEVVTANPLLQLKSAFLNTPFFFARMIIILLIWSILSYLILRESHEQDKDGALLHTERAKKYSAIFLVVFAITFSLASFDWLMSIEPEFYSTIYAFYCIAGLLESGIAAIALLTILLHKRGLLTFVSDQHLLNLGKLLFGFSTFWAYIWLSQYLLIYYANIPEETVYYFKRTATVGWTAIFIANLGLNWLIPFILLLTRRAKQNKQWLATASVIALIGHWTDLYTLIFPAYQASARVGYSEIGLLIVFAIIFLLLFMRRLAQWPLLPARDPYLAESLHLVKHENKTTSISNLATGR